jgi:hypothetical protein
MFSTASGPACLRPANAVNIDKQGGRDQVAVGKIPMSTDDCVTNDFRQ